MVVEDGDSLTFVMLPVPSNADVHAILDRIMRRVVDHGEQAYRGEAIRLWLA